MQTRPARRFLDDNRICNLVLCALRTGLELGGGRLGQLHRSVIVAMIAVRMMKPSVHEVVDVIAVRHCLVSAARAVRVT